MWNHFWCVPLGCQPACSCIQLTAQRGHCSKNQTEQFLQAENHWQYIWLRMLNALVIDRSMIWHIQVSIFLGQRSALCSLSSVCSVHKLDQHMTHTFPWLYFNTQKQMLYKESQVCLCICATYPKGFLCDFSFCPWWNLMLKQLAAGLSLSFNKMNVYNVRIRMLFHLFLSFRSHMGFISLLRWVSTLYWPVCVISLC